MQEYKELFEAILKKVKKPTQKNFAILTKKIIEEYSKTALYSSP